MILYMYDLGLYGDMNIDHSCTSIHTHVHTCTIKFQNLVCKVSVSALYYLPIPIFTYTMVQEAPIHVPIQV